MNSEFDPSLYTFGIPTMVDVKDPKYQKLYKQAWIKAHQDPTPYALYELHMAGRTKFNEAARLEALNQEVAANSHVYLSFNGMNLIVKKDTRGEIHLPFKYLWHPDSIYTRGGVQSRSFFRDTIALEFELRNGHLVFNNVGIAHQDGQYSATGNVHPWLVNLIGSPILTQYQTQMPEQWAEQEVELVNKYRELDIDEALATPCHPLVGEIISRYDGFVIPGYRTAGKDVVNDISFAISRSKLIDELRNPDLQKYPRNGGGSGPGW